MPKYGSALSMNGDIFQKEYKSFEKQFKTMCKENDWTLVDYYCGHEFISAFIRDNRTGNYVYMHKEDWNKLADMQFVPNVWLTDKWLIRECKNRKDYTGGINCYFPFSQLSKGIESIFYHQKIRISKKVLAFRLRRKK